jgi:hypothetical protein
LSYCSPIKGYTRQAIAAGDLPKSLIDPNKTLLFKTKIDFGKRHYSGLLIAKYTSRDTAHISFVTEIGMGIFDFIVVNGHVQLNSIIAPLQSPRIVQLLKKDLGCLFLTALTDPELEMYRKKGKTIFVSPQKEKVYLTAENNQVSIELVKKNSRKRALGTFTYSAGTEISEIHLKRKGILKISYSLSSIES